MKDPTELAACLRVNRKLFGPEVRFGELSSLSDVFQSQIVIHRVS